MSWLSARLRRAAALVGRWGGCRCCQLMSAPVLVSADCARCGGAVSWLRKLRTFLFQPVACQQVVGFGLAIWVYAGVIESSASQSKPLIDAQVGRRCGSKACSGSCLMAQQLILSYSADQFWPIFAENRGSHHTKPDLLCQNELAGRLPRR